MAGTYKVLRKPLGSRALPPLVDKLAGFLAKQKSGSLGWFEGLSIEPIGGSLAKLVPEQLRRDAIVLALLPDGERIISLDTAVVLLRLDGTCRLLAPSLEAFLVAWAKSASGISHLDHDGSLVVAHHGSSATTRSVPSARKALQAWLKKENVKPPRGAAFDLDAYLGTTPAPDFGGKLPRVPKLEAGMIEGKRTAFADYGKALAKLGHPLAEVIAADVDAMRVPARKRQARATFQAYVKEHLAPRYSAIANNMIHFSEPAFPRGMSFRYGLLETLDTFSWTRAMVKHVPALLADDHARWAIDVVPRDLTFENLDVFAGLAALRRLNFQWSTIREVSSLAPLAGLRHLQALNASRSAIADLAPLRKVPVVQLYLRDTGVVDLSPLAGHPTLACLDLQGTQVRDIRPLLSCKRLCNVGLWDAKVSADDARLLLAAMRKSKARPTSDQTYLIDGFYAGVSHQDI